MAAPARQQYQNQTFFIIRGKILKNVLMKFVAFLLRGIIGDKKIGDCGLFIHGVELWKRHFCLFNMLPDFLCQTKKSL